MAGPISLDENSNLIGDKRYELSNHLGNVLAVIKDKKLVHLDANQNLSYFKPEVLSYNDYYPFGTIKRQWGFDHILSKKGKKRASADVGFIFIAYNLKRILSLMGKKGFREVYAQLILCLSVLIQAYKAILIALHPTDPVNHNSCLNPDPKFKNLILVHNWQ